MAVTGRKLVLTGTSLSDAGAPRLVSVDPIEAAGSLLLLDWTHPAGASAAGLPASGTVLRNLVDANARRLYGGGSAAQAATTLTYANLTGARGRIERTGKGGLHVVVSQADDRVTDMVHPWAALSLPALFATRQFQLPTNDLYVSAWVRVTRGNRHGTILGRGELIASGLDLRRTNYTVRVANVGGIGGLDLGYRYVNMDTPGVFLANNGSTGWSAAPLSATDFRPNLVAFGHADPNTSHSPDFTHRARWPSWVLYRLYAEDLTVSGRTYAQVDDLDLQLYTREVLTAGGRYYGDTYTDPATIP